MGGADDLLEVEVRNKFSGTRPAFSRFLGKLTVPLVDLFECQRNRSVLLSVTTVTVIHFVTIKVMIGLNWSTNTIFSSPILI